MSVKIVKERQARLVTAAELR